MIRWTASALERLLQCGPSAYLPQTASTTEWAQRGSVVDAFGRAVLTGTPRAHALAAITDKAIAETCRNIDFGQLGGDLHDVRCQVAYSINVETRTARELGVDIGRDYERFALAPTDVVGTLDIEGTGFDDTVVVEDIKAGYQPVTACADNAQMKFYCAARMLVTGADAVEARIRYVRASGKVYPDIHTFTRLDVDTFLDEVEDAMARTRREERELAAGGALRMVAGDHCGYCGALAHCPEKTRLARAMLGDLSSLEARIAELPLEQAGAAWRKADEAEALLKRIYAALEERARLQWLPTEPGKCVRPISFEKEQFSQGAALELLRELGATEAQLAGVYKTIVIESVRETRDPNAPREARRPRKVKAA